MDAGQRVLSSEAARYAGRRLFALIGLLLVSFWALDLGLLVAPARAQERRPAKAPAAVSDRQFTIAKIEPDAGKEEVQIFFSKAVPLEGLRGNLRLLPLVKIDWPKSAMSSEGRLTLKGRFKYGLGYVVNLPENFTLAGQTYVPTVTSFFMPDRPPKLEYRRKEESHRAGQPRAAACAGRKRQVPAAGRHPDSAPAAAPGPGRGRHPGGLGPGSCRTSRPARSS